MGLDLPDAQIAVERAKLSTVRKTAVTMSKGQCFGIFSLPSMPGYLKQWYLDGVGEIDVVRLNQIHTSLVMGRAGRAGLSWLGFC